MKLFMDKYRSATGLEMREEDAKLTSGDAKFVSIKSNLIQKDMVGNVSSTPGGFENIGSTPGGAISLLANVGPANDLLLVTHRYNFVTNFAHILMHCNSPESGAT